ncbi:flagellar protein FlaG [Margalitia sp. FSL K6-0131]|uniref:flagellar protein FlaG n=1 Tax=Margalitia sp. FSL K6-0131 TaxID=2954604 RepID=UPI0030F7C634
MEKINSTFIPQIRKTSIENYAQQTFEGSRQNLNGNSKNNEGYEVSETFLKDTVETVEHLLPDHYSVKYNYHEKTQSYYVQVIDDNNNEVIREIPSEKLLDTYASMKEMLGILFDIKI